MGVATGVEFSEGGDCSCLELVDDEEEGYVTEVLVVTTDGRTGVVSNESGRGERTLREGVTLRDGAAGVEFPCALSSARGERLGVKMRGATLIECLKSAWYVIIINS
jgi:hypothetical protein